jgi:hypothetical protein
LASLEEKIYPRILKEIIHEHLVNLQKAASVGTQMKLKKTTRNYMNPDDRGGLGSIRRGRTKDIL